MKRMLINVTHGVRVALIDGNRLENLEIERTQAQKVNNIYLGKVNRVEPSLGAAFVNYGSDRDGFLPAKEVSKQYFKPGYKLSHGERPNIREILESNQEILVQVVKEQRGNKGAALRTFVSLAGRYLVLMPNNPKAGGISRQIEGDDREELKGNISQLEIPDGMGVIVRTAGVGRSLEELKWDFDFLLSQWEAILDASKNKPAPYLIYQESDVITRALRDNLKPDIEEILIDDKEAYEHAKEHLTHTRPEFLDKLKFYEDSDPLFNRFEVESQIESAFQREVKLNNGASIVIDPTEALTAIDINSAKATEGADIEETAFKTNLAAADEIARQLRLRDIGGLIVIDFIDMTNPRHQRDVEKKLRDSLQNDRARVQMGRISRFGLLEMSRQRLQPSLGDANQVTCPTCDGQGAIRGVESLSLSILRVIEEESMKPQCSQVRAQVPVDVATYLINEKRETILDIENRHGINILVIANQTMSIPHYEVARLKSDEVTRAPKSSYKLVTEHSEPSLERSQPANQPAHEEPAIKQIKPDIPPPPAKSARKDAGFMRRLWDAVFKGTPKEDDKPLKAQTRDKSKSRHGHKGRYNNQDNQNRNRHNKRGGRNRNRNRNQDNRNQDNRSQDNRSQDNRNPNNRNQDHRHQDQKHASKGQHPNKENIEPNQNTEVTSTSPEQKNQDRNRGRQGQDKRKQNQRNDRNRRNPNQKQTTAKHTSTDARAASADELQMHKKQQNQQVNTPELPKDAMHSKVEPVKAKVEQRNEPRKQAVATQSVVEVPVVIEPPRILTPEEAGFRQANRRNQTGFFKISKELAKQSFIQPSEVKMKAETTPLQQVKTNDDIEQPRLVAPPLSQLAQMPSKPKVVLQEAKLVVESETEQSQEDFVSVDVEEPTKVDAEQS